VVDSTLLAGRIKPKFLGGAFVYQLGHGPLKAERRVRFPYALPIQMLQSFSHQAKL